MKANELRIGNYIYANKRLAVVVELTERMIRVVFPGEPDHRLGWVFSHQLSPIMLTDDVFDVISEHFNRENADQFMLKDDRKIFFDCGLAYLTDLDGSCCTIWDRKLKKRNMYLHEWQNLYFALSGEEITLNVYSL